MKYKTLADLITAYRSEELSSENSKMYLDANDATLTVSLGSDKYENVFTADPSDLIMQCLDLFGIPWEWS